MRDSLTNREVQWAYLLNMTESRYSKDVLKKCLMFHLLASRSSVLFPFLKKLPSSWWPLVTSLANATERGGLFLNGCNKTPGPEFPGPSWAR